VFLPKANQFQRRIALAGRGLDLAIDEYRNALEAGRKWSSAVTQDAVAKAILRHGQGALPESAVMQKAAAAAGFGGKKGMAAIDDSKALVEMAYLMLKGAKLKPASFKAALLAQNDAGAARESVAHRLREKFNKRPSGYLKLAEQLAKQRAETVFVRSACDAARRKLGREPSWREYEILAGRRSTARSKAENEMAELVESLRRGAG
jgi:hypothetical protein